MTTTGTHVFGDMLVDHIEFYVTDIASKADWWVNSYGFAIQAATPDSAETRSLALGHHQVHLVLTEATAADHPGTAYVRKHGDGVANIGLRVNDAAAAFHEAVRRGARPVSEPVESGGVVTASILGFGDVVHTFVHRTGATAERTLPGLLPIEGAQPDPTIALGGVDHFAVCVEAGQVDATVEFYREVLDFELIFTEKIAVGAQAMTTKVVESTSGAVTLTLIEPDVTREPGHIDDFLRDHAGAGVQHIAFATDSIVTALDAIYERGVAFLDAPGSYYTLLAERVTPIQYSFEELRKRNILVDEDHDGQLYQIFTMSVHPRNTIFFELIERLGARSFGSGNITALYQAVELQRNLDRAA